MAPRSAKTKKTADVKVAVNEAPKKGRGKTKNLDQPENEVPEMELNEKVSDKKTKRGKKAINGSNGLEPLNDIEDNAPPAKKGKKKMSDENSQNGNNIDEVSAKSQQNGDTVINGDTAINGKTEVNGELEKETEIITAKSRKKPQKKESQTKPKKNAKAEELFAGEESDKQEQEAVEEKPKVPKSRGRKAQTKAEVESEDGDNGEAVEVTKPTSKGRKKAQSKPPKEKSPEKDEVEDIEEKEIEEDLPPVVISKKGKGKRNQGKKVQAKDEADEEVKDVAAKKQKLTKKDEKAKGDTKDEEAEVVTATVDKPVKGKRGQKKAVETTENDEQSLDGAQPTKRRRKQTEEKAPNEDKKKTAPKNKAVTDYESLDFSNTSKNDLGKEWNFKISSWNVDGIRAWLGKGGLDYLKYEKPDILCLQEVKCAQDKLPEEIANVPGYHAYWLCSDKDGYAGVGVYTTKLAMNVQYGLQNEELDNEGRIITAEYEHFYLISTYVPNAGRKLVSLPKRLQWNEEFRKYVKELDKKKPVIICGDMNVAHNEIDLTNPKTNKKNAGFTIEEREGMTELLGDGFVDTFRHLNPDKTGSYTFWTYMMNSRAKNVGWRLDYFIVSERLLPSLCDSVIREQVYGSDHCPISLFMHLSSASSPK